MMAKDVGRTEVDTDDDAASIPFVRVQTVTA